MAGIVWLAMTASITMAQKPATSIPVQVVTAGGQQLSLQLDEIRDGQLHCEGSTLPLADLMLIDAGRRVSLPNMPVQVYLTSGGNLPAARIEFAAERFRVHTAWGLVDLAPDNVAGVILASNAERSRFDLAMKSRSVEQDQVIADAGNNQQLLSGLIESIDSERLMLNYQGSSRSISLTKVIAFISADLKPQMPPGPLANVRLIDGGSLSGVIQGLVAGKLTINLPAGTTLAIPWSQVSAVSISSSSFAWISDLEPTSQDFSPLATLPFTARNDTSVDGNPMTLVWNSSGARRTYHKGIGTRSASRIEFENTGDYQRLVATVGIDSETDGKGDCQVSVWGDDIQLWSAEITGAGDPVPLDISIDGMKRITLVVRVGRGLDMGDHVDWAEARLVKSIQ